MERYSNEDELPRRTERNSTIYDEVHSLPKEPTSNVTILDDADEIDIKKIRDMINNREEYRKARKLNFIIDSKKEYLPDSVYEIIDEVEQKNYDINEILKNKKGNKEYEEGQNRVRKISDTQYDILKNLNINRLENEDGDVDEELQEKQLRTLINNITKTTNNKDIIEKTAFDLFGDLKGDNTEVTPPAKKENKIDNIDTKSENTFYSSSLQFKKEDFEDFEDLKTSVKKNNLIVKLLIIFSILVTLGIGYLILIQYVDLGALLK